MSFDARLFVGAGEDDRGAGERDFLRDDRLELREGVLYGVSVGVGSEAAAAAANSSSVSQAVMIAVAECAQQVQEIRFPNSSKHPSVPPHKLESPMSSLQWDASPSNEVTLVPRDYWNPSWDSDPFRIALTIVASQIEMGEARYAPKTLWHKIVKDD
jgi:hypothetical protein